jgi:hypothetical protein
MRVIRTEMYFDASEIEWAVKQEKFPGVSVAWLRFEQSLPDGGADIMDLFDTRYARRVVKDPIKEFLLFADLAVQAVPSDTANDAILYGKWDTKNAGITKRLLEQEIVLEKSPASLEKLINILKTGSGAAIGTYVLYSLDKVIDAIEKHPLMLIVIPLAAGFGIIVIGASVGISEGLRSGLHKRVEEWAKRIGK